MNSSQKVAELFKAPKESDKVKTSIYMDKTLMNKIEAASKANGKSINVVMNAVLEQFFKEG